LIITMRIMLSGKIFGRGGIQSHLRWLARALREAEVETLIISLDSDRLSPDCLKLQKNLQNLGVQLHTCTANFDRSTPRIWSKFQQLLEIKTLIDRFSPDIYLAVGTGWNLFVPPLLSQSIARRIFYEVMSGKPSGWQDSRWCVRGGFDEVIGQSPIVAKTFAQCFDWKKTVSAIPALPEPLELTATLPTITSNVVEFGQAKAALFSRLEPHKQAFWLVQQWDSLKDFLRELHIHGTGSEETLIRNYIEAREIGDRVKCFGRYPEGQAYVDLLSSYDLTLLPTIGAEGAPLVLLESMACGVPFVACGVGGIPDYGVNNPNVSIVPPDGKVFISGVKHMVHKLANSQIDQLQLQQFYLNHYSYKVLKNTWLSYLESQS
jgi:glycosyltransferase involved in cell wall biosynthesis